jgi:MFS family permease
MRRLLVIGSAVVFLDVVFYAAITPLLPGYVDDLGLSKTSAGVLSGAYAAGTLVASLPAGFMAARVGPRLTLLSGLALLGAASLAFGFGRDIALLDAARFAQGVAGALAWAGAITWLMVTAPASRRGAVIGDVLAIAIAGARCWAPRSAPWRTRSGRSRSSRRSSWWRSPSRSWRCGCRCPATASAWSFARRSRR